MIPDTIVTRPPEAIHLEIIEVDPDVSDDTAPITSDNDDVEEEACIRAMATAITQSMLERYSHKQLPKPTKTPSLILPMRMEFTNTPDRVSRRIPKTNYHDSTQQPAANKNTTYWFRDTWRNTIL